MKRVWLVTSLCLLGSVPGFAQTSETGPFVTGSIFASIDRSSHSRSIQPPGVETPDLSGTTLGGGFGAGVFLAPRWSANLEFSFGSETDASAVNISGSTTQTTTAHSKFNLGSVLLGYHHTATGRCRLALFAGISFVQQQTHAVIELAFNPPLPVPPGLNTRGEQESTNFRSAASVGLDMAIAVAPRFDIIPNLRGHVFAGIWSLRPGVMARWRF